MKNTIPQNFPFPEYRPETKAAVLNTCIKMKQYFYEHENILISVSGGSDSDCIVHLVCKYFPEYLDKIHFVFVNTGLEYDATKRHLCELESKYGIEIQRIRGLSVVTAVRRFGFPILSKIKSKFINHYLRGNPCGEKYVFMDGYRVARLRFTEGQKNLARYLKENGIMVSEKCCDVSKKQPIYIYISENKIDLNVTGERSAEGGQRSLQHKSCFEPENHGVDKYMPLWWWSDAVKRDFKNKEELRYSDCYEVYGMKRTGCCGCPFNLDIGKELQAMYIYEPKLYKGCMAVFGQAYELTDRFNCRRKKCLPEAIQLRLF